MSLQMTHIAAYHGPNPLAPTAVCVAKLACQAVLNPQRVHEAAARLWKASGMEPVLSSPLDPAATEDGLLLVAHTAATWAQAALNESRGFIEYAGARRAGDNVLLWVGFHDLALTREAIGIALTQLVTTLQSGSIDQAGLGKLLERFWVECRKRHPDFQARILMVGARAMNVPWLPFLSGLRLWQFGWGSKARVFRETLSNADGALGVQWQRDKIVSKQLIRSLGLPAPRHVVVTGPDELAVAVKSVGFPCVVKPIDGGGGRGVTAGIVDGQQLKSAFDYARTSSRGPLLVEQHVPGNDFRLLLIKGRLVAALERTASELVGDGQSSVKALLDQLNAERPRNLVKSRYLKAIAVDDVLLRQLSSQGMRLEDVPPAGHRITLRSNANRSTGGVARDVTTSVHPVVRAMAEQLAAATGLSAIGIDYLTTDITCSPQDAGGSFIEINATPGMSVCVAAGWSEAAIARLILGDAVGTVPISLTIVPAGHMAAEAAALSGMMLEPDEGCVCGNMVKIGTVSLQSEVGLPWNAVYTALRNPALTRLRITCSAEDIINNGVPVEHLANVILNDASLPSQWQAVLAKAAVHHQE